MTGSDVSINTQIILYIKGFIGDNKVVIKFTMNPEAPRKNESSKNPFVNERHLIDEAINFIKSNPNLREDGVNRFLDSLQIDSNMKEGVHEGLRKYAAQEQEERTKRMENKIGIRGQQGQGYARKEEKRWRDELNA